MIARRWIPSTSALLAFESAARHSNFSRAAEELNTSQSAISRHIGTLESRLGTRLFDRSERRLRLTREGEQYHRAVLAGLEGIQAAAMAIADAAGGDHVTIACTHEVSHLFILPRFEALQAAVGADTRIHVMTVDYEALEAVPESGIDLVLAYDWPPAGPDSQVVALAEAVAPVCSPAFAARHRAVLDGPPQDWGGLPFLSMSARNRGWATWDDWFAIHGVPTPPPRFHDVNNYVYLLEAAAAGRGLALGWRGLIDRYLDTGALVLAADLWAAFDHPITATLTRRGRGRAAARTCLDFFDMSRADG